MLEPNANEHQYSSSQKEPTNTNVLSNTDDTETIYLDAEVIESPSNKTTSREQHFRHGNTTFTTFTWSSINGFERGWNNAYRNTQAQDPYAHDIPHGGPKTSRNEWKRANLIGGAAQTLIGGAIALAGIPMLILPGPGLLAIGLGGALAAGGIKKILTK